MTTEKIYNILKINAGFELDTDKFGMGSIAKTFKPKHGQWPNNDVVGEYIYEHYPKCAKNLESLPWTCTVKFPRYPSENEYPTEDGIYITMMDCNEHEVCTNKFHDGHFAWMNKTHIKWWMKLPE